MQCTAAPFVRPRVRPFCRPLLYRPRWEGEIQGYAYNSTRRYWPTLSRWYEWPDLMQEAYIVFMACERKYTGKVNRARWFMALFKTAWHNRLVNIIVSVPRYSLLDAGDGESVPDLPCVDLSRELWDVARSLPRELQVVLGDVCRLRPRFNFSKRALRDLRVALVQS